MVKDPKIKVAKDGPYIVTGGVHLDFESPVPNSSGDPVKWVKKETYAVKETYSLCRCGRSIKKPFCDGRHTQTNFSGREMAGKEEYLDNPRKYESPELDLLDIPDICSGTRFCHPSGGVWGLTKKSGREKLKKIALQESMDCPSGRLTHVDKKSGKPVDPVFPPSISATDDPGANTSGPLWVKGGIPVESSEGRTYRIRNRVTLCRCGKSLNKPFCDGAHMRFGTSDDN